MSPRFNLIVCIVAVLALTGCGRRGALEPPPGAPPEPKASQPVLKPQTPGAPGGLFRNTALKPEDPETRTEPPQKKSSSFLLDPLL